MSDPVSKEKIVALREVTNHTVPDSRLRRELARCGGNLNTAAAALITESLDVAIPVATSDVTRPALCKPNSNTPNPVASSKSRSTRPVSSEHPAKISRVVKPLPVNGNFESTHTHRKDTQANGHNASTPEAKRAAWRQFYLTRREEAIHAVGLDKKLIDKYIAQAWSDMGSSARREYISRLAGPQSPQHNLIEREADSNQANIVENECGDPRTSAGRTEPVSSRTWASHSGQPESIVPLTGAECALNETAKSQTVQGSSEVPDRAGGAPSALQDASQSHLQSQPACESPSDRTTSKFDGRGVNQQEQVSCPISPGGKVVTERPIEDDMKWAGLPNNYHKILPVASEDENLCTEIEWPRKLTSRLCGGVMLVRGGGKSLVVGDELVLEAPPPPRRILPGRRRPTSGSTIEPTRIARFSKNGRELGRLAPDIGRVLAPALNSKFLTTTCRVVTLPETNNMFAEIILDISISLNEEAFAPQDNVKIEGGYEDESEDDDKVQSERGIDSRRLSIVNLISSLNICELHNTSSADIISKFNPNCEDAGIVKEGNAENYYRTITEIDEKDAESFSQSRYLSSTLREYQRVGVKWMISREKFGNLTRVGGTHAASGFMINPLWKKRRFPDGGIFYMNSSSGCLLLKPPPGASGGPYGGILADEMGLGKTVQCIACIVHDEEEQRSLAGNENISQINNPSIEKHDLPEFNPESKMLDGDEADENASLSRRCREGYADPRKANISTSANASDNFENDLGRSEQCGGSSKRSLKRTHPNEVQNLIGLESDGTADQASLSPRRLRPRRASLRRSCTEDVHYVNGKSDPEDFDVCDDKHNNEKNSLSNNVGDDGENDFDDALTPLKPARPSKRVRRSDREFSSIGSKEPDGFHEDEVYMNEDPTESRKHNCKVPSKNHQSPVDKKSLVRVLMSNSLNDKGLLKGGTLIVCPTSLVTQWMNELETHVRPRFLRVVSHYGQSRGDRRSICKEVADVVVTTYGILASEFVDDGRDDKQSRQGTSGPIFQVEWRRVILDEAHTIKSRVTRWAKAAYHIITARRWCVTGTVIHNHVNDVFSLLHFLQLKPWSAWAFWNRGIVAKLEGKDVAEQKIAMSLVRDIVSSITLRRKKSTLDSLGRPIVQLTKKTVELVALTPSPEEWDFYAALEKGSKVKFGTFLAQGKVMNNYASVLELLLRLRQACDHPYLVFSAAPSKDVQLYKDKDKLYKAFIEGGSSSQYIESILSNAGNEKSRECPICLDVIEDGVAPKECGHPACRDCLTRQLRVSNKCPVCRTIITAESVTTLPRSSRFSVDLEKRWRSSIKIETLLMEVRDRRQLRKEQGKRIGKTVVFSQFTSMLDLVQHALGREHFPTLRIDGSVPQAQRAIILEKFDSECELDAGAANILLVSLRAGGVGLNLVSASHAILLDIHWNPQVDAQAQDRIHRHGQQRDVLVRRYVIKNSVEDRLLTVQSRKQDLANGALDAATDEDRKQARLSELKLLFAS